MNERDEIISYDLACKISDYLLVKNMGFCFLENGMFITRELCNKIIDEFNTITK